MSREEMVNKLAKGLLAEWRKAKPADKRGMWRAAVCMPPGMERMACLRFMRMAEQASARGEV